MKKIIFPIIILSVIILFTACDRVEGPYVVINDQDEVTVDFPDLDPTTVFRKVLIEEYTGHRCPNCPNGHEKLEELLTRFGDTLIPVCIHATSLAAPTVEFPDDLRAEAGLELATDWQIDGIPAGVINRADEPMGSIPARWLSKVNAVDRTDIPAAIQLINQYNENGLLKVNAKVTMLESHDSPLRLSLFIVEDGIVSPQINGTETIENYVHNHVLRGSINGTYGQLLNGTGELSAGESCLYAKSFSFVGTNWKPEHCSVVAILYDKNNYNVLQVERCPVTR
ncbi:MAG: Omp28 family outer membrane lipoprotein [Bacteroidales bacterium]|nr:Omp28 family outer membrane lipoprotein [Bacteroidales bacterium]